MQAPASSYAELYTIPDSTIVRTMPIAEKIAPLQSFASWG